MTGKPSKDKAGLNATSTWPVENAETGKSRRSVSARPRHNNHIPSTIYSHSFYPTPCVKSSL